MVYKKYNLLFLFIVFLLTFNFAYSNAAVENNSSNIIQLKTSTPDEIFKSGEFGTPIKLEARIDVPMELSLEEALNLAIAQNLDVELAKHQKDIDKWRLWENL